MCLFLTVHLWPSDAPFAERIARAVAAESGLAAHVAERGPSGRAALMISETGHGCACSLLADSADWNAATWDMWPKVLPELAKALHGLDTRCRGGFDLDALWIGDAPRATVTVTVKDLARLVLRGQLGNKIRYRVQRTMPSAK